MTPNAYDAGTIAIALFGALSFLILLFIPAPYGRHSRPGWGPAFSARISWIMMEAPAPLVFGAMWWVTPKESEELSTVILILWMSHYLYRAFIYPLRMRGKKTKPIFTSGLAFLFNTANGAMCGYAATQPGTTGLDDPRVWLGALLFLMGMVINHQSDHILRKLRHPRESGYRIPRGGLYTWISCPNYLGEIIEWLGFAILVWSDATSAFAFFTACNLLPRAIDHHQWYRNHFPDYPKKRRVIVPFLL